MKKLTNPADIAFLRENIDRMSYDDLGRHFGVSPDTVRNRCKEQSIAKSVRTYATQEQKRIDAFIRENLAKLSSAEIAERMGISHSTVSKRIMAMGLKKTSVRVQVGEQKLAWLRVNVNLHRFSDLASRLGISAPALRRLMRHHGIERDDIRVSAKITSSIRRTPLKEQPIPKQPSNEIRFVYDVQADSSREDQLREFMRKMKTKEKPRRQLFQPVTIARI